MLDYLPREIFAEILHRQTLKSLVKCTSVCKAWKSLITDSFFISEHISRTREANNGNESLLFRLSHDNEDWDRGGDSNHIEDTYSLRLDNETLDLQSKLEYPFVGRFWSKYFRVVGTCNGLVFLVDYGYNFIIWNPSIRKYVVLPEPSVTFKTHGGYYDFVGSGFNSKTRDFIVVRLVTFVDGTCCPPEVELYSLAAGCWKRISDKAPQFGLKWQPWAIHQVFINGVLHWTAKHATSYHNFILSFDVNEESFGELMLPEVLRSKNAEVSVLGGGESLAVVHHSDILSSRFFSVWVMREYGVVESWTMVYKYFLGDYEVTRPLTFRKSGEVILTARDREIISLDPMVEPLMSVLMVEEEGDSYDLISYYVESLYLLNKEIDAKSY